VQAPNHYYQICAHQNRHNSNTQDPELEWDTIAEELASYPVPLEQSGPKLYKLAKELKCCAALMTTSRDLQDIHRVHYLASAWEHLSDSVNAYTRHRMRLLYIAITKEWPTALYFDQQGSDEFLELPPVGAGVRRQHRPRVRAWLFLTISGSDQLYIIKQIH
jgi:hypothetical protein